MRIISFNFIVFLLGSLLGVEYHNKSSIDVLWVCFNVSAKTEGVTSLMSDTPLAIKLSNRWNDAFASHGSTYANQYGIPTVVGSSEFTFPMLASEVLFSIELAAFVSGLGFILLLCIFTSADVGLTLLGTLAMFVIIIVAICIHEYFFVGDFDLLDIVVLIAIMGMAVDFPIHYLMEFVTERQHYEKKLREQGIDEETDTEDNQEVDVNSERDIRAILNDGQESLAGSGSIRSSQQGSGGMNPEYVPPTEAVEPMLHHHNMGDSDAEPIDSNQKKKFYPPLKITMKYMTSSLIAPLILTFLSGFPLLFAEFQLLRKCGQYIIILALVSYVYCVFFLAYLMPLGCRTRSCDRICGHIDPEVFRALEVDPDAEEEVARNSPLRERLLSREESQIGDRWSDSSHPIVLATADFTAVVIPTTDVVGIVPVEQDHMAQDYLDNMEETDTIPSAKTSTYISSPHSPVAHQVSNH